MSISTRWVFAYVYHRYITKKLPLSEGHFITGVYQVVRVDGRQKRNSDKAHHLPWKGSGQHESVGGNLNYSYFHEIHCAETQVEVQANRRLHNRQHCLRSVRICIVCFLISPCDTKILLTPSAWITETGQNSRWWAMAKSNFSSRSWAMAASSLIVAGKNTIKITNLR